MTATSLAHVDGPPLERLDELIWIGDIPALGVHRCPERPAIICPDRDRSMSYAELDRACDAFVQLITARGIKSQDRIAYLGKNNDIYLPVLFGAVRANVVIVPLNWRLTAPELAYQLEDSESRLLLHDPDLSAAAAEASSLCSRPPSLLPTESASGSDCLRAMLSRSAPAVPAPRNRDQALLQLYTSGTTGRPKGVLVSQYALTLTRHAELISPDFAHLSPGSVILSAMPNFHVGGMSWVLMGLVRFGTVILTADASPGNMLALLRKYNANHSFIVPTVIRAIVDELQARKEPPPQLSGIYYGAMAMSESLLRQTLDLFKCAFVHFFGMTEIAGSATFLLSLIHI